VYEIGCQGNQISSSECCDWPIRIKYSRGTYHNKQE